MPKTKAPTNAKKEKALKFFMNSKTHGSWLVGMMQDAFDQSNDGSCDMRAENDEDARYADRLTADEYANAMRLGFIAYLESPKGAKDFEGFAKTTYAALTDDSNE